MVTQFPPVREFCGLVSGTSSGSTKKRVECLSESLGELCAGLGECCGYVRVRGAAA